MVMTTREELESVCKRRGFIWQSSEIYGGEAGFYDYGHLGARLKDSWEEQWKDFFLSLDQNYHLVYTPNILPYRVLESSGHVEHFSDVLIKCNRCGNSFRGDHLVEDVTGESAEWMGKDEIKNKVEELNISCPDCKGDLGDAEDFNMMFEVDIGPKGERKGFLRPETAQGTYMNFPREYRALRRNMPFGLATVGPAFRNEISPRQGVYRMREFQQAELQIFFIPSIHDALFEERLEEVAYTEIPVMRTGDDMKKMISVDEIKDLPAYYIYHLSKIYEFYKDIMEIEGDIRLRELSSEERAFYNKIHFDVEINMKSLGGWKEVAGLHYRSDHDLSQHQEGSNKKMSVPADGERKVPHVIELSFGVDRNIWALLDLGYRTGDRDWLTIPDKLAPYQVAVFPLVRKDGLLEKSEEVFNKLNTKFRTFWDVSGSIGKRYARQDEIGTPYCVTVDYDTMEEDSVTIREIKTTEQIRVSITQLEEILQKLTEKEKLFDDYMG